MLRSIHGQAVWVTGAGTGIGRAGAIALAAAGARVALTGRRVENLEETAARIRGNGGEVLVVPADMRDAGAVEAAAKQVLEAFGRCDILVNSAGINIRNRSWESVDTDGFDSVLAVDLNGCFYACRAVLPAMRAQAGGLIIQISSWAGRYVAPAMGPAYAAAKHGLNALSESINQTECVNGVRSCCICPGEVDTPILDGRPVPVSELDRAKMLQPDDLAQTILFVSRMPESVCLNEILMSPTWNRGYIARLS
jgi:NADP-dependent 3-hydroxy acid dehydrogenase YdfG